MGRKCSDCEEWYDKNEFSRNQWNKGNGSSRCKSCVDGYSINESEGDGDSSNSCNEQVDFRYCRDCGQWCDRYEFGYNQWLKGDGASRCKKCSAGCSNAQSENDADSSNRDDDDEEEGRKCTECEEWCGSKYFSRNQWGKGDGSSRCRECILEMKLRQMTELANSRYSELIEARHELNESNQLLTQANNELNEKTQLLEKLKSEILEIVNEVVKRKREHDRTKIEDEVLKNSEDERFCVICQEKPKSVLLMTCRHLCVCSECGWRDELDRCSLCRENIVQRIDVFS